LWHSLQIGSPSSSKKLPETKDLWQRLQEKHSGCHSLSKARKPEETGLSHAKQFGRLLDDEDVDEVDGVVAADDPEPMDAPQEEQNLVVIEQGAPQLVQNFGAGVDDVAAVAPAVVAVPKEEEVVYALAGLLLLLVLELEDVAACLEVTTILKYFAPDLRLCCKQSSKWKS